MMPTSAWIVLWVFIIAFGILVAVLLLFLVVISLLWQATAIVSLWDILRSYWRERKTVRA